MPGVAPPPAISGEVIEHPPQVGLQIIDLAALSQEPLDRGLQQVLGVRPVPGERDRGVQQMISTRGQQLVNFLIRADRASPAWVASHGTTSIAAHQGRTPRPRRCLGQQ
jgi:hypothetical protein